MKVYIVFTQRTDDDGWPKGDRIDLAAFTSVERAREFMYVSTKNPSARKYGWATVAEGYNAYVQYGINIMEVIE